MDPTKSINTSVNSYGSLDIEEKKYSKEIDNRKNAWLSAETTIEEINVIDQYFQIEGYFTVIWKDEQFDQSNKLSEVKDTHISKTQLDKLLREYEAPSEAKLPEENKDTEDTNKSDAHSKDDNKAKKNNNKVKCEIHDVHDSDQKYIKLTKYIDTMQEKEYDFPWISVGGNNKFILFKNAIEYTLTGSNPIDLEYNIHHHVFKLHINFRCKLYECFENNEGAFPFERQFLNAQIPYNICKYKFSSTCPQFVKRAFWSKHWKHAPNVWKHVILARKRDSIDEWKLLSPWIDLRKERKDYNYEFYFGLIKYRVIRNPHFYMLNIILPLCLMVSCSFAILSPIWNETMESISDRLTYIVTLLLTVAAFQISITAELPYKSQFTLIDQYFLLAYLILAGMVLEQTLVQSVDIHWGKNEAADLIEIIFGCLLAILWLMHTLRFILRYFIYTGCRFSCDCSLGKDWEKSLNFITCGCCKFIEILFECCIVTLCCCSKQRKKEHRYTKWMRMEKTEASSWDNATKLQCISQKPGLVFGTVHEDVYTSNNEIDDPKMRKNSKTTNSDQCDNSENELDKYTSKQIKDLICKQDPSLKNYDFSKLKGFDDTMTIKTIKQKVINYGFNDEKTRDLIVWAICHIQNEILRSKIVAKLQKEQDLENIREYGCFCGKGEVEQQHKIQKLVSEKTVAIQSEKSLQQYE